MHDKLDRFQVFYDGDCPLCKREIDWLRKRDKQQQIAFIDIASDQFPEQDYGKSFKELMSEIHGRQPDGQWITGVEVFRRLYAAAGFRRSVWVSKLPVVRHGLHLGLSLIHI